MKLPTPLHSRVRYLHEAWRLVRKARPSKTGWTVLFSGIAAVGVVAQWIVLDRTLNETRAEFRASRRADVVFGSRDGVLAEFDPNIRVFGKKLLILHFRNAGQSTARWLRVQVLTSNWNGPRKYSHVHRYRTGNVINRMGMGAEIDLAGQADHLEYVDIANELWTDSQLNDTSGNELATNLDGEIAYCDVFGVYHCTPFNARWDAYIQKFVPFMPNGKCTIEPAPFTAVFGQEIEKCEQAGEIEYYTEQPATLIATPTIMLAPLPSPTAKAQ
jgi:hypothetical protein